MLLVGAFIARLGTFIFKLIAMRNLSIKAYGDLSLFLSLFASFIPIATFSIAPSLSKFAVNLKPQEKLLTLRKHAIKLVLSSSLLACVGFIACSLIFKGYKIMPLQYPLIIASFFSAGYISIAMGFNLAELKFGRAAFYESVDSVVRLLLIVIAIFVGINLNDFFFTSIFCFSTIIIACYAIRQTFIDLKQCLKNNKEPFLNVFSSDIFHHSSYLMLISFTTLIFAFLLRYFLSIFDHDSVGIFDLGMSLYTIPKMIFASIVRPITPLTAKNRKRVFFLPNMKKMTLVFLLLIAALYIVYQANLASIIFKGLGIERYLPAFPVFITLFTVSLFDLMFGYLSSFLQAIGEISYILKTVLVSSITSTIVSYFLAKSFSINGAITGYILFYCLSFSMLFIYCKKACEFKALHL